MIKQDLFFGFIAIFFFSPKSRTLVFEPGYIEIMHDDACRFEVMVFDIVDPGNN